MLKEDFEDDSHFFRKAANDITSQLDINFGNLPRPGRGTRGARGGRGRVRRVEDSGARPEMMVSLLITALLIAAIFCPPYQLSWEPGQRQLDQIDVHTCWVAFSPPPHDKWKYNKASFGASFSHLLSSVIDI